MANCLFCTCGGCSCSSRPGEGQPFSHPGYEAQLFERVKYEAGYPLGKSFFEKLPDDAVGKEKK